MKLVHLNEQETDLHERINPEPKHFFRYGENGDIVDLVVNPRFQFGMYLVRQAILNSMASDEQPLITVTTTDDSDISVGPKT